jgi:shikimate kinase
VLLIGMMGSGKSTTGRTLAVRLGATYLDSDEQVEAATGRTVPEILRSDGEAAFRLEESQALQRALEADPPVVVAVAGGAVLDPVNRQRIADGGTVVWLRAAPPTLARRVGGGHSRPLLDGDPAGNLARLDAERRPLYAELADVVVDVDDLTPEAVADAIVAGMGARA